MSSDRAMKYSAIIAAAIPILLAVPTITNVYASVQGSELGFEQGQMYGDPNKPNENSKYFSKNVCYDTGHQDGENGSFDEDFKEGCDIDGRNPYEDGFDYGCESQRTEQRCNT